MNPTPSKKPSAIVMVLLAIGSIGISYWHYTDMVKPIPEFESLKQIPADGMRYEIAQPRGVSTQVSFEFTDQSGNRFETDYMEADEARAIKDALERGGVILSVGRWKRALESNSIFTVYHMTRGDKVLIDYKRIAESKKKEQQAVPVVVILLVLIVGIVAFAFWKQYKRAADAKARG
jgi:hypothetical protein